MKNTKPIRLQEYKTERLIKNELIRYLYTKLKYKADNIYFERIEDETIMTINFKNGFSISVGGDDEGYDTGFFIEEFKNKDMKDLFETIIYTENIHFSIEKKESLLEWILKLGEL